MREIWPSCAFLQTLLQRLPFFHKREVYLAKVIRLLMLGAVATLAVSSIRAQQSENAVASRVVQKIDNSVLTTLKGNTHPLAKPQYDRGPANPSLLANRMQLVLQRSSGQEMALRRLLGAVQDKNSSQYRKWLTADQFGAQYGVSTVDIQKVTDWLASQGFQVAGVNRARTILEFSGNVGQLQTAFHTQIHHFNVNGEEHLANVSDPQIPAALAPVVAGLSCLTDFFPKPLHTKPVLGKFDKASGKLVPALTDGTAAQGYTLFMVPGDAATIYDTPNLNNRSFSGSTAYTGASVNIAIAGVSNINTADVTDYGELFGLGYHLPTISIDGNNPGETGDADEVEALLDLEIASALAPNANLTLYIAANTTLSSGLFLAINRALDDNVYNILNVSFGGCEGYQGSSGNQLINTMWEQAAAQGVSVTVSSGDSGSAGCDSDSNQQAQAGLAVNGLASTPYNIAVGGTDFDLLATDFTKYVSATNGTNYVSALSYIPEQPWNNSTVANGLVSANTPSFDSEGDSNIVAAGGGASGCVLPQYDSEGDLLGCGATTGTLTGWPKPSWQMGSSLNIPADGVRDVPDVSLFAANGQYSATWLVCYSFTASDGTPITCAPNAQGEFYFIGVGGTSSSAPAFAGMLALVSESQGGARLGQANYVLYNLANRDSLYNSIFHDTTAGNNAVYCALGSADCGANLFQSGYQATTGYDQASGLGSVDATQLINNWATASFAPSSTSLTINGGTAPVSITHGQPVTLNATVAGAGGTPGGQVSIVAANYRFGEDPSIALFDLSGGAAGPKPDAILPGGSYTAVAYYSGDITFAQSQSMGVPVNVAPENSVLNLFAVDGTGNRVIPSGSYPYGIFFGFNGQPVGLSQVTSATPAMASGLVTFNDTTGDLASIEIAINSAGYAETPYYYLVPAVHSVSAFYGGDSSLRSSTAGPLNFTITPAPTTSTVASGASSVSSGTFTVSSLITPTPAGFAANPTGTVTLTANGATIGSGSVMSAQDPNTGASLGTATITVSASSLSIGINAITATYSGNLDYAASSGAVSVTSAVGVSLASTAAIVSSPGQSGSSAITVTPNGYTGTLNLACVLSASPSGANATYNPTCTIPASVSVAAAATAKATASFATTAATTGGIAFPLQKDPAGKQRGGPWYTAAGAALACLLFFGMPARQRGWRSMLGLCLLLVTIAGIGCGGKGGGGSTNDGTPGTTTGAYTFTVTGTDSITATITGKTTVTVTVN